MEQAAEIQANKSMYPGSTGNGDARLVSIGSGSFGMHNQANSTSGTNKNVMGGGQYASKYGIIGHGNQLLGTASNPGIANSTALVTVSEYQNADQYNSQGSNLEDDPNYRITKKQMKNLEKIFFFYAALHQPKNAVKFTFEEI